MGSSELSTKRQGVVSPRELPLRDLSPQSPSRIITPPPHNNGSPGTTSAAAPQIIVAGGDVSDSPKVRASTLAYGARGRTPSSHSPAQTATINNTPASSDNASLDNLVNQIKPGHSLDSPVPGGPGPLTQGQSSSVGLPSSPKTPRGSANVPVTTPNRAPSTTSNSSAAHHLRTQQPGKMQYTPNTQTNPANTATPPGSVTIPGQQPRRTHSRTHSRSHSHSRTEPVPRKPQKRTSIGPWDFVKSIGAGSMGQVKLAVHRYTRQPAAIKIVPKAFTQRPRDGGRETNEAKDARVIREAAIGRLLDHPNVSKLYDVYSMTGHFYLVFEYIAGGQMLDYIITHGCVKEVQARRFARSIASALDYCHHNSVVHRDLKIENILIADDGDIRLIDFGLSNLFRRDNLLKTFCGSLYFAAPELLNALPYVGPEIDVWSFGVVLYVLVCGKVPFEDKSMTVLHAKIKRGTVEYPTWLSSLCTDLLGRMLTVNPSERATLSEVMHHPWMIKGYEGPPENYMPPRLPLRIEDLDPGVVDELAQLGVGDAVALATHLQAIVGSAEYEVALAAWREANEADMTTRSQATLGARMPDPLNSFAPELSFYYLARERLAKRTLSVNSSTTSVGLLPPVSPTPHPPPPAEDKLVIAKRSRSKTLGADYAPATKPVQSDIPMVAEPQKALLPTPESSGSSEPGEDLADVQTEPPAVFVSRIVPTNSVQTGRVTPVSAAVPIEIHNDRVPPMPSVPTSQQRTASAPVPPLAPHAEPSSTLPPASPNQQFSSLFRKLSLRRRAIVPPTPGGIDRTSSASHSRTRSSGHTRAKSTSYTMKNGLSNNESRASYGSNGSQKSVGSGMPSIEAPRHVFFRGIFSVQSTSTKPLREIRAEIIRVLTQMNIEYVEVLGGFACVARTHRDVEHQVPSTPKTPRTPHSSASGEPFTPNHRRGVSDNGVMSPAMWSNTSSDSVDMEIGGSDMLGLDSGVNHTQIPVRFEIDIVRVPIVSLHGVQFKKMTGNVWQYKNLAQEILNQLRI